MAGGEQLVLHNHSAKFLSKKLITMKQQITELHLDDTILHLNETIDYRVPNQAKISKGKIEEFRMIDKDDMNSPWMKVVDINEGGEGEWIPANEWKTLLTQNIITHGSNQQTDPDDLPF